MHRSVKFFTVFWFLTKIGESFYLFFCMSFIIIIIIIIIILCPFYWSAKNCDLKQSIYRYIYTYISFPSSVHHKKLADLITTNKCLICLTMHYAMTISLSLHAYLTSAPFNIGQLTHFYPDRFILEKEHLWSLNMAFTPSWIEPRSPNFSAQMVVFYWQ